MLNVDVDIIPPGVTQGTDAELEERRQKVLALRLRRYSQKTIAQALGVSQATVSADLKWIADHRKELYGTPARLKVEQEIGEAIDIYAEIEVTALKDLSKIDATDAKARNGCMRTVIMARSMRVSLLQDLGFIDRQLGVTSSTLTIRAEAVRKALRDEGLLVPEHATIAHLDDDDDEVHQWLKRAE